MCQLILCCKRPAPLSFLIYTETVPMSQLPVSLNIQPVVTGFSWYLFVAFNRYKPNTNKIGIKSKVFFIVLHFW
jgi:hypothetical protein